MAVKYQLPYQISPHLSSPHRPPPPYSVVDLPRPTIVTSPPVLSLCCQHVSLRSIVMMSLPHPVVVPSPPCPVVAVSHPVPSCPIAPPPIPSSSHVSLPVLHMSPPRPVVFTYLPPNSVVVVSLSPLSYYHGISLLSHCHHVSPPVPSSSRFSPFPLSSHRLVSLSRHHRQHGAVR